MIKRYCGNPILQTSDWGYPVNSVFNPGAIKLNNGKILLLCRCEDMSGISHFSKAISANGYSGWNIDSEPCFIPEGDDEIRGIEDPRIVWLPEKRKYAVIYTSCSLSGPGVSIALTKDFVKYDRLGQVFFAENKDAFLFPYRLNGLWMIVHRPVIASDDASIWVSYSPDLIHWGNHKKILSGRGSGYWDGYRVGGSIPFMQTLAGWLMIYHSNKGTPAGCMYRCGAALLDLEDPSKILYRSTNWFFGPEASYERTKLDKMATLDQQLSWLTEIGFADVDCMYKYYNFVVMFARKDSLSIHRDL